MTLELEQAQQRANKAILEAEKFRTQVEQPGRSHFMQNLDSRQVPPEMVGDVVIDNVQESDGAVQDGHIKSSAGPTLTNIMDIGSGVSDDDFFHLTCHIEPNLIHKIEKGEFVKLEKLLPKDKFRKPDEGRMEWVHRDGNTFLVPAQKDNKISSFRRWEQAFRAYATIYCKGDMAIHYCN